MVFVYVEMIATNVYLLKKNCIYYEGIVMIN